MSSNWSGPATQLTDPGFFEREDYHALFARMRREAPVFWTEVPDLSPFWSVFRYADALKVLGNPTTFSSEVNGVMLPTRGIEHIANEALGAGENILQLDPPLHLKIRKIVAPYFHPNALRQMEEQGRALISQVLDEAQQQDSCDLVEDVAMRIPMGFIFDILRIPRSDRAKLTDMTSRSLGSSDPELMIEGDPALTMSEGLRQIRRYVYDRALERKGVDGTDPIASLVNAEVAGTALARSKIEYNAQQLITAGLETTRSVLAAGTYALTKHPDQFEALRNDPGKLRTAIEELIRWSDPAISVMRTALHDTVVGDREVRKGDRLVVWVPSANRDESVFDKADEFNIERSPNRHMTFGVGEHACIGLHLAKMEIGLYLTLLMERFERIEVVGAIERVRSNFLGGIKRLPVRLVSHSA